MEPFTEKFAYEFLQNLVRWVTQQIMRLDNEYVLNSSQTELEAYYVDEVLIKPLILYSKDQRRENPRATQIYSNNDPRGDKPGERPTTVQGTKFDIIIPFEGDYRLWSINPSNDCFRNCPDITVQNDEIFFSMSFADSLAQPELIQAEIKKNIESLEQIIGYLNQEVIEHNDSATNLIKQAIEVKKAQAKTALGVIEALGIQIKRKNTSPILRIPLTRKTRPVVPPSVTSGKYIREPVLEEKEYQYILEILRSVSLVIERCPSSFASISEEAIRDHFLIQLNGHYEGGATGETFNASGKTDILIREENKNVFIAECKFWSGQKNFKDAVYQLLSYLTWRDSKCALLIFNKTKNSSSIRNKMNEAMEELPEHRRTVSSHPDEDPRYILIKESEPGKEIIITTQLYDIPTKQ